MSVGWEYVSELRPLTDLQFIPQIVDECVEIHCGMIRPGEKLRIRRKTCPSATLCTTDPTCIDPVANLGLRVVWKLL
jgi:hypothetical protein